MTQTDMQRVHCIFVVPDKHKRRLPIDSFIVNTQSDFEKRIAAESLNRGPNEGRPSSETKSFTLFSFPNNDRIKSQTRVIEKNPIVHFCHINFSSVASYNRVHRCFEIEWDFQVSGKMIKCAERQDSEDPIAVYNRRRD